MIEKHEPSQKWNPSYYASNARFVSELGSGILKKLFKFEISSILVEGGKTLITSLLNNEFFNEFYLFISSKTLNKKGSAKISNIKRLLFNKFKYVKFNETFLDKDNLIHYY